MGEPVKKKTPRSSRNASRKVDERRAMVGCGQRCEEFQAGVSGGVGDGR